MDAKRRPIENDEPRHRKKSKKKGRPRADHKHEYKTVLLCRYFDHPFKPGERVLYEDATKVCAICGRVGEIDRDQYELVYAEKNGCRLFGMERLRDKGTLEKWYIENYLDKFAKKMEET